MHDDHKNEVLERIAAALERIADVLEGAPITAQDTTGDGGGNGNGPPP